MNRRTIFIPLMFAVLIGVSVVLSSCGGGQKEINISGSSTVYPLTTAVAEEFQKKHSDVRISVTRDGSSGGFENAFLPGNSAINNSSRPIHENELQEAEENGFEVLEIMVARDALTAVVNNKNDWVGDCITLDTLKEIWSPDDTPKTWQDVNTEWPDEEFSLYGPASTSGTFDYFTKTVIGETGKIRSDFEGTEEDDLIAQGVEGSKYAHGYLPYAYYRDISDKVKALELDDGNGCVEPNLENASTGDYPLARPLFIYVNKKKLRSSEILQKFVRFYIKKTKDKGLVAEDVGYVQMSEKDVQKNLRKLEEAIE